MAASSWRNLGKLIFKEGFGVYIDGSEVFIARVGFGLFGPVLQSATRQQLTPHDHAAAGAPAEEADGRHPGMMQAGPADQSGAGPWRTVIHYLHRMVSEIPVLLEAGIPDHSVFFSAVATNAPPSSLTEMNSIIAEHPKTSFLASNDLVADWTGRGSRNATIC